LEWRYPQYLSEAERLKDMLIAQALTKAGQSEDEENQ
jgi:hypothetical protein